MITNIFNGLNNEKIQGLNYLSEGQSSINSTLLDQERSNNQLSQEKSFDTLLHKQDESYNASPPAMSKNLSTEKSDSFAASKPMSTHQSDGNKSQINKDETSKDEKISSSEKEKDSDINNLEEHERILHEKTRNVEQEMSPEKNEEDDVVIHGEVKKEQELLDNEKNFTLRQEESHSVKQEGEKLLHAKQKNDVGQTDEHALESSNAGEYLQDTMAQNVAAQDGDTQNNSKYKKGLGKNQSKDAVILEHSQDRKSHDLQASSERQEQQVTLESMKMKRKMSHNDVRNMRGQDKHVESSENKNDATQLFDIQKQDEIHFNQKIFSEMVKDKSFAGKNVEQAYSFLKSEGNNELVQQAKLILQGDKKGEIKIMLNPKELGEVKLSFNLDDNKIVGKIVVVSEAAKEALQKNMDNLERQFNHEGYDVGGFFVLVDSNNSEKNNEEKDDSRKQRVATIDLKRVSNDILLQQYIGPVSEVIDFVV